MPGLQLENLTAPDFVRALGLFKEYLSDYEQLINELNVFPVPDSDTGTNSLLTFSAGLANLSQEQEVSALARSLATGCAKSGLGNSGVILAAYLVGFAEALTDPVNVSVWQNATRSAAISAHKSVLHPTQGTMLTIATEVSSVRETTLAEQFIANSTAARLALVKTTDLLPELKLAGVVDSGAVVLTLFHDAFAKLVTEGNFTDLEIINTKCLAKPDYHGPNHELMFSIILTSENKVKLLTQLEKLGDSISISEIENLAGSKEEVRVHIHCDDPDQVITEAKTLGKVFDLVLINLTLKNL